jgi:hypothetical protein
MDPICENQNDGERLQAALLSTIVVIHCKGLIKGGDFTFVIFTEADASEPSFIGVPKEMVERRNNNISVESLRDASTIIGMLRPR